MEVLTLQFGRYHEELEVGAAPRPAPSSRQVVGLHRFDGGSGSGLVYRFGCGYLGLVLADDAPLSVGTDRVDLVESGAGVATTGAGTAARRSRTLLASYGISGLRQLFSSSSARRTLAACPGNDRDRDFGPDRRAGRSQTATPDEFALVTSREPAAVLIRPSVHDEHRAPATDADRRTTRSRSPSRSRTTRGGRCSRSPGRPSSGHPRCDRLVRNDQRMGRPGGPVRGTAQLGGPIRRAPDANGPCDA